MMRSFPFFLLASALVVGCASSISKPPVATVHIAPPPPASDTMDLPPPPARPAPCHRVTMTMSHGPGWHELPRPRTLVLVNEVEHAKVMFIIVQTGAAGRLRLVLAYRHEVMGSMPGTWPPFLRRSGDAIEWGVWERRPDGRDISRRILAQPTNIPGYSAVLIGEWPADINAGAVSWQFTRMAKTMVIHLC